MKKIFKVEVDCAACALKIEEAIKKIEGVNSVSINFFSQKMIVDIDEDVIDETLKKIAKTAKKIEPDFRMMQWVENLRLN